MRQRIDQALIPHWRGRTDYTVLDTAFEFGARFLAVWQAWRETSDAPRRLHYVALVPRLYSPDALTQAHSAWPEWDALARTLRERQPCALPGMHRISLPDAGVRLTLVLGEKAQGLDQIDARVDCFLPDQEFFQVDVERLRHGLTWFSRLATAHSQMLIPEQPIDEALLRVVGFVTGRDRAVASFAPRWQVSAPPPVERRAIVIGAGLAGSAVSQRLRARGWDVQLIERHADPAQEASGNLAGIFMPVLARDDNPLARFSRAAFLFALRLWRELGGVGTAFDGAQCGVLQLDEEITAFHYDYPNEFARITTEHGPAWLFEQGGWANPAGVCRAMLDACGDRLTWKRGTAARLEREGDDWCVFDEADALLGAAPHLVLANGTGGKHFAQTQMLPLTDVRGQVTHIEASRLPPLNRVLCGDGYITPPLRGLCCVGASYDNDADTNLRADSQRENLARLARLLPDLAQDFSDLPLQGRTGFRCVAPDRLPLVGSLPDCAALAASRAERLRDVPRHAGLYAVLGLASRGLTWSALAAELLAAQMSDEPLPIERDLYATLDPARFALQQHRTAKKPR
ncbi:MAG: FAD-dependent 5-carboxymethylaminomethyl-2-thiouridine(34) oxidoreductase MnmC [Burkholderiaceae bacterium]|nr:FAD-dependent 5-carboxymethylaminomethyl-2-thiouridine(34) oxidoreductase MnmC [Burkholderiaceae bacterium]